MPGAPGSRRKSGGQTNELVARLETRRALEALLEALDLAGRVDDRLLAREERVAVRADVDAQRACVEPTSNSVWHEPQTTFARWYLG